MTTDFQAAFQALTGKGPFLWQERLFHGFRQGSIPPALDIPTGLGKTSVIAIWLIALAEQGATGRVSLPRRLVYVVDRRTVVDQATDVAVKIQCRLQDRKAPEVAEGLKRLSSDPQKLLAISTLRGEFADNKEWQADPARPAIIVGTVDMIGSRLLFSGYGVSQKMRPFHAGLLGQDTLIVHDEAHLSPAFGKLINDIAKLQEAANEPRPIRVMELSATQRGGEDGEGRFALTAEEEAEPPVVKRLLSGWKQVCRGVGIGEKHVGTVVRTAVSTKAIPSGVVICVQRPETAREVATLLPKGRVAILTGTHSRRYARLRRAQELT